MLAYAAVYLLGVFIAVDVVGRLVDRIELVGTTGEQYTEQKCYEAVFIHVGYDFDVQKYAFST